MSMIASSTRGGATHYLAIGGPVLLWLQGRCLPVKKIAIRRSGLLFDQNQLLQDINAGQQLAVTIIRADNELNDTDSVQDIWAQPIPPYNLGT